MQYIKPVINYQYRNVFFQIDVGALFGRVLPSSQRFCLFLHQRDWPPGVAKHGIISSATSPILPPSIEPIFNPESILTPIWKIPRFLDREIHADREELIKKRYLYLLSSSNIAGPVKNGSINYFM